MTSLLDSRIQTLRTQQLSTLVEQLAAEPDMWLPQLRLPESGQRWWTGVSSGRDVDVWLLSWLPGHDGRGAGSVPAVSIHAYSPPLARMTYYDTDPHRQLRGALVVERNVLEWRFDPTSDARFGTASYDLQVIVVCNEGYPSSLAAAALQELGVWRATDIVGGYRAWRAAALPTVAGIHAQ